jgi:hypothetical protein
MNVMIFYIPIRGQSSGQRVEFIWFDWKFSTERVS